MNDVLHKALHGGLAAAGAATEARISHIKGAERKKRILGAAGGAIVSEIVSESMMSSAMRRMETQLLASGHAPNSKAYTDLRQSLLKDEFLKIKTVAQLAVTAAAESMKFDLNSALSAANNALENNFAQVFSLAGKLLMRKAANEAGKKAVKEVAKEAVKTESKEIAKSTSKQIAKNLVPGKLNKTRVANGNKKPHGNSLKYKGNTHVYSIHRLRDKKAFKAGESTGGVRVRDGASKRAESQVRKLARKHGEMFYSKIRKQLPTKVEGKNYEANLIKRARDIHGPESLPLNKNGH